MMSNHLLFDLFRRAMADQTLNDILESLLEESSDVDAVDETVIPDLMALFLILDDALYFEIVTEMKSTMVRRLHKVVREVQKRIDARQKKGEWPAVLMMPSPESESVCLH